MMRGAIHEQIKAVKVYEPETVSATVTDWNGHSVTQGGASGIDLQGYDEAMLELCLGSFAGGNLDVEFYHSATDDGTAATQITEADGTVAEFAQKDSADADKVFVSRIRAKDVNRYLFIKATNSSADAKTWSLQVLLGKADDVPVTQDNTVDFTHSDA